MMETHTFDKEDTLAIKGVACMMLLWHHLFIPWVTEGVTIDYFPLNSFFCVNLAIAFKIVVSIYAFLSAYGITKSLDEVKYKEFLDRTIITKVCLKRFLSLMQNYLFIFIGSEVLCLIIDNRQATIYGTSFKGVGAFLMDFFGLANLFATPQINATWWYMSLAILIILIVPVLYIFYDKLGLLGFLTIILVMRGLRIQETDLYVYLPTIMGGVAIAKADYLAILKLRLLRKHKMLCFLILTIMLCLCIVLEHYARGTAYNGLMWAIETIVIIVWLYTYLLEWGACKKILGRLGMHSANIFYTHTFISKIYLREWTYSFRYAFIIFAILLVESLLVSVMIEKLKDKFHYNQFCDELKKNIIMNLDSNNKIGE